MPPACSPAARFRRTAPATRLAACLCFVLAGAMGGISAAEPRPGTANAVRQPKVGETRGPLRAQLVFRGDAPGRAGGFGTFQGLATGFQVEAGSLLGRPAPSSTLLRQYSEALSRESRRSLERDPSVFWSDLSDEDGYLEQRARRAAERIFGGASSRVASDVLERVIEGAAALRSTRDYLEGIRFDVRRGGGVEFGKGQGEERADVAARFNLIVAGTPRLELRTTMPGGIKTRLEIPITSPGIRATMSRPLGGFARGHLSAGVEDEDRWISATVGVRF